MGGEWLPLSSTSTFETVKTPSMLCSMETGLGLEMGTGSPLINKKLEQ